MGVEENKAVVLKFLKAVSSGDLDTVRQVMPEDGTWWIPKHLTLSGVLKREDFLQVVAETFKDAVEPLTLDVSAITAEEDRVCVEAESHLNLPDGRHYNNEYHWLFRLRDGKIISGREHMNTLHLSKIFGV